MATHQRPAEADGILERDGSRTVLRFRRHLAHPVERVWVALTEPGELSAWWGDAEIDLAPGGRFVLRWRNLDENGDAAVMHATITRLEPPRLLETVGDLHGTLRWELEPEGDGTRLSFSSTLELPEEYRAMVPAGWHYHLDALEIALAGGRAELVELPNPEWEAIHARYRSALEGA